MALVVTTDSFFMALTCKTLQPRPTSSLRKGRSPIFYVDCRQRYFIRRVSSLSLTKYRSTSPVYVCFTRRRQPKNRQKSFAQTYRQRFGHLRDQQTSTTATFLANKQHDPPTKHAIWPPLPRLTVCVVVSAYSRCQPAVVT